MARDVHRREDLLRDATALAPRVMLRISLGGEPVELFAGFRGEALSLYFGEDPAYHFNEAGELRRAYVGDRLIRAERGRLVALRRQRRDSEVALIRREMDESAERAFFDELSQRLSDLHTALIGRHSVVVGQVPSDGDALDRLKRWLDEPRTLVAATSPGVD